MAAVIIASKGSLRTGLFPNAKRLAVRILIVTAIHVTLPRTATGQTGQYVWEYVSNGDATYSLRNVTTNTTWATIPGNWKVEIIPNYHVTYFSADGGLTTVWVNLASGGGGGTTQTYFNFGDGPDASDIASVTAWLEGNCQPGNGSNCTTSSQDGGGSGGGGSGAGATSVPASPVWTMVLLAALLAGIIFRMPRPVVVRPANDVQRP